MDVHEVREAEFFLGQDRGDQMIVFQNVDRSPLCLVRIVQGSHCCVFPQIVRVTGKGIFRHVESGQVLTIGAEPVDFPIRAIGNVKAFQFWRYSNPVTRVELSGLG